MQPGRWLVAAAVAFAAKSAVHAFDAAAREKIAVDALRLAPPVLSRQLARHRLALVRGATQDPPTTVEEAVRRLATEASAIVSMIDSHQSFRKISESLGRLAGTAACLNDPLWSDGERGQDATRFSAFFEEKMARFPLVFAGYDSFPLDRGDLAGFARSIRERSRRDGPSLHRAFHPPDGGPVLPSDFDERSIPFAIASLAYSHAVTDTAYLWVHVWRSANGDLSGTPYLAVAQEGRP